MSEVEQEITGVRAGFPAKPRLSLLRKLLITLFLIIVAILCVAYVQPSEFHVERTCHIGAVPKVVFDQVNDLRKWSAWSPWAKLDPAMKTTFEGPNSGVGAVYVWSGNADVGEGKMTIVRSEPPYVVDLRLEFVRPYSGRSDVEFRFRPVGSETDVTWSIHGTRDLAAKVFSLFVSMDEMIGTEFDKGLSELRSICETVPKGE